MSHAYCPNQVRAAPAGPDRPGPAGGDRRPRPQTIVVDGVNDFLPANLVDADGGDTQFPNIDLGDFYVTNDAVKLYLGFEHDQGGWGRSSWAWPST